MFFQARFDIIHPDIVIMRRGYGVVIIEVKDYNPEILHVEDEKNWYECTRYNTYRVHSPITQVENYKRMLCNWYIPELAQKCILNGENKAIISSAVFMSRANKLRVNQITLKYGDFFTQKRNGNFWM